MYNQNIITIAVENLVFYDTGVSRETRDKIAQVNYGLKLGQ